MGKYTVQSKTRTPFKPKVPFKSKAPSNIMAHFTVGEQITLRCAYCTESISGRYPALNDALRKTGWTTNRKGRLVCPKCTKERDALISGKY